MCLVSSLAVAMAISKWTVPSFSLESGQSGQELCAKFFCDCIFLRCIPLLKEMHFLSMQGLFGSRTGVLGAIELFVVNTAL